MERCANNSDAADDGNDGDGADLSSRRLSKDLREGIEREAALAMFNLTLSVEGSTAIAAVESSMAQLRRIAAESVGATAAKKHAQGALFVLTQKERGEQMLYVPSPKGKNKAGDTHEGQLPDDPAHTDGDKAGRKMTLRGKGSHIMLSYNWGRRTADGGYENQKLVKRVHAELCKLGYKVWLDVEEMKVGGWVQECLCCCD